MSESLLKIHSASSAHTRRTTHSIISGSEKPLDRFPWKDVGHNDLGDSGASSTTSSTFQNSEFYEQTII